MLTGPSTPFDEDGWAAVLSDLRRINLMVSGGSNDLNSDSTDVAQTNTTDNTAQAVDAELLQGVPISEVAPTDGQNLQFSSVTGLWTPGTAQVATVFSSIGTTTAVAINNNQVDTTLPIASVLVDTESARSGNTYVIPTNGIYQLSAFASVSSFAGNYLAYLGIYANGTAVYGLIDYTPALNTGGAYQFAGSLTYARQCTAGDVIDLRSRISGTFTGNVNNTGFLTIVRLKKT